MPLLVRKQDDEGDEQWMCGNCFGFVAPAKAIEVPMETPRGTELRIPYCVPCVDRLDYTDKLGA